MRAVLGIIITVAVMGVALFCVIAAFTYILIPIIAVVGVLLGFG